MAPTQQKGQAILLACIGSVVAISVTVIALYIATYGTDHLPVRAVRFALTVALCRWLYLGSDAARITAVILFVIAGAQAAKAFSMGGEMLTLFGFGAMSVNYFSIALILIFSSSVGDFLEYQQNSLQSNR